MPTLILRQRNPSLTEKMDDPDCDPVRLDNTYAQFSAVNRVISGWGRVYKTYLRPLFNSGARTVLDIGCGGGDVARFLRARAARDGYAVDVTGIDPDKRAIGFACNEGLSGGEFALSSKGDTAADHRSGISDSSNDGSFNENGISGCRFIEASSRDLVNAGNRYDIVLSNHLLHHLSNESLKELLEDSEVLCKHLALHNDIRRDDLAWIGFTGSRLLFHRSFITEDGLRSIRRSFTPQELKPLLPLSWSVQRMPLFRMLTIYRP